MTPFELVMGDPCVRARSRVFSRDGLASSHPCQARENAADARLRARNCALHPRDAMHRLLAGRADLAPQLRDPALARIEPPLVVWTIDFAAGAMAEGSMSGLGRGRCHGGLSSRPQASRRDPSEGWLRRYREGRCHSALLFRPSFPIAMILVVVSHRGDTMRACSEVPLRTCRRTKDRAEGVFQRSVQ